MLKFFLGFACLATLSSAMANTTAPMQPIEGVGIDRTRVVIGNGETRGAFGVTNKMATPVVVTSWVTDLKGKVSDAFVVTPSLYQLDAGKTGNSTVRLTSSDLPQDRESVFWLVVNSAAAGASSKNSISVAVGQRIKVFYRPVGVKGDAKYAAQNLVWSYENQKLKVRNPTALSVSISDIQTNGKELNVGEMVMPFSEMEWSMPAAGKEAKRTFSYWDEFGGLNELPIKLK